MATVLYDLFKAVIQTVADTAGGVQKMMLGTPGDEMIYPEEPEALRRTQDTGQAWDGFYLPLLLGSVGSILDQFKVSWGFVTTNATGVTPTLQGGFGFSATVSKNETSNTLTLTFDPNYGNNYVACCARPLTDLLVDRATTVSSSTVVFEFYSIAGVLASINDRTIMIICVGNTG